MSEVTIVYPPGHIIIVECANCHQEIEVPAELIGDNLEPDQILPYICDECETKFDEAADDADHECPCGCEGNDSRCVYTASWGKPQ